MTNVVKKGSGRAAHAERTAKHAQRTPLPPKAAGKQITADIIKDEVQKAVKKTTKARARKSDAGTESMSSLFGPLTATARKSASPKKAAKKPAEAATPKAKAKTKPSPKKAAAATPTPKQPVLKTDAPKVLALVEHAHSQGWAVDVALDGPYVNVTSTRAGETLVARFIDNKMDDTHMPYFVRTDGSEVLMRNISAVKKQMMSDPAARPVRSERQVRSRSAADVSDEPSQRRVPFDIERSDADEVAEALRGATITWRNGSAEADRAVVSAKRAPQIRNHPKHPGVGAKRFASFFTQEQTEKGEWVCGPERHVSLDRLLTVTK
jgi:hypothetical protein